jgi:hypothetical protein
LHVQHARNQDKFRAEYLHGIFDAIEKGMSEGNQSYDPSFWLIYLAIYLESLKRYSFVVNIYA